MKSDDIKKIQAVVIATAPVGMDARNSTFREGTLRNRLKRTDLIVVKTNKNHF